MKRLVPAGSSRLAKALKISLDKVDQVVRDPQKPVPSMTKRGGELAVEGVSRAFLLRSFGPTHIFSMSSFFRIANPITRHPVICAQTRGKTALDENLPIQVVPSLARTPHIAAKMSKE